MRNLLATLSILCVSLLISGCAFDVIRVEQISAKLDSDVSCNKSFVLAKNVDLQLGGYNRILKKGTRWNCMGSIAQGDIYKTKDQVLTIEASNIFEAHIVVNANKLVGFYLPVEHTFSRLDKPIELTVQEFIEDKKHN